MDEGRRCSLFECGVQFHSGNAGGALINYDNETLSKIHTYLSETNGRNGRKGVGIAEKRE